MYNQRLFFFIVDLSNDSYGTVVNMGLDGEGASPGGGGNGGGGGGGGPPRGYLGATTPPYLSTSRSPSLPPQFPYALDTGLSVYTTLGKFIIVIWTFFFLLFPKIEKIRLNYTWKNYKRFHFILYISGINLNICFFCV